MWHTYTQNQKLILSPSLRLPNSTQKLRSCYAISARFKVPLAHTYTHMVDVVVVTVLSRFHWDCTTIQAIIWVIFPHDMQSCNDVLSVTSSDGRWSSNLASLPFSFLFSSGYTRGTDLDRKYFITLTHLVHLSSTLLAKTTLKINKILFKNGRKRVV